MDRGRLTKMLIEHEGVRLKPYMCPAGRLTIGVGRNLDDAGISMEEALHLLENDVARVEGELDRALPWWRDMDGARQAVLADMAFNMGVGGLLKFKRMLEAAKSGGYERAAEEMMKSRWAGQVGRRAQKLSRMMRNGA